MTKAAETVLADALRLDPKGRAELARELLASLDDPADTDAASAWADEIRRRVAALDSGSAELESWDDATGRNRARHPWPVSRRVRNLSAAREEFAAAVAWYEQQRSGLGAEFFDSVTEATSLIRAQPHIGVFDESSETVPGSCVPAGSVLHSGLHPKEDAADPYA